MISLGRYGGIFTEEWPRAKAEKYGAPGPENYGEHPMLRAYSFIAEFVCAAAAYDVCHHL
jgi:hypothetical protein